MNKKISIILPTFNEKGNILPLIDAIRNELENCDHEILVIDDNSSDGTYKSVLAYNCPSVRGIRRTGNYGLANSIRCGLEKADGQIFVVMDSDFNHQPKYIPFMIQSLSHYDFVSTSRFLYGAGMDGRLRYTLSRYFNAFIRLMTGGQISDNLYGFFATKRETIEQCKYDDIFWGYGDYFMRLLYYLQKGNVSILQVPVINGERRQGRSKHNIFKVFWKYFSEIIKLTSKARLKNAQGN